MQYKQINKMKKKLIELPDGLFKKIQNSAKNNHRTVMAEIREILIKYFKR